MNYSYDIQPQCKISINDTPTLISITSPGQISKIKPIKLSKKIKVKMSSFSWSKTQEKKYISFLKANANLFSLTPQERKQIKINVMMSYAVKTRSSAQCHSHHQKMMIRHGTIERIIESQNHLFEKEIKIDAKEQNDSTPETIEMIKIQPESILEEESKEEPMWWRYLDLMDEPSEEHWNHSLFFSQ